MLGMTNVRSVQFPFAKSLEEVDGQIKRVCKGVPVEITELIKEFQPYKGGDGLLWGSARLASSAKHQRVMNLIPLCENWVIHNEVGSMNVKMNAGDVLGINKMAYLRNELEFARISKGGHFYMNFSVTLNIFISNAEIVGEQPVLDVLNAFASKVERIVKAIESETIRISGLLE